MVISIVTNLYCLHVSRMAEKNVGFPVLSLRIMFVEVILFRLGLHGFTYASH